MVNSTATRRPMPKSRVSQMTVSVRNCRPMLLEVLFDPAGSVGAADLRIDTLGDHLGAPRTMNSSAVQLAPRDSPLPATRISTGGGHLVHQRGLTSSADFFDWCPTV